MSCARALALVSLVLLLGQIAAADDALTGPHALDDGMRAMRRELTHGNPKKALPRFQALLEEHKGKDYAKARRPEIEELMMHLACGVKFKRPKVKDLLSGKVRSWSPKTGKIKITYTPKTIKDLELRAGLVHLPARLSGPFSFEIKGASYPTGAGETLHVLFGGDQHATTGKEQAWRIELSAPQKSGGRAGPRVTGTIVYLDGGAEKTVSEKKVTFGKKKKPYKFAVKVSKTKIALNLNARSLGYAKKPRDAWGFLSFRAGTWTELKLSGTIEPDWIESRLAEVFRTQLAEFRKDYDPSPLVPKWLSAPFRREESRPDRKAVDLLARLSSKHYDLFLEVDNDVRNDEPERALKGVAGLQSAGVPEATCEWMRAQICEGMTQLQPALVHLQRVVELEPDFLDGVLLRGSLLRQLGRFDEALETFQKATGLYAQFPSAYTESATAMLYAGRPEAAKRITQAAARNGVYSPVLLTLNGALAKVVNGPRWQKRYEYKSQSYHVLSNIDPLLCREAAKLLEEALAAYQTKVGEVPRDKSRLFKVYLFSDQAGFLGYMGNIQEFMGKPNDQAAGLYSPLLKQLLIWNLPRRSDMLDTIRHEGFHQYLDRLMPNPPVWFNEGMAVYHENGKKEDGQLTFGHLHPNYVRLLRGNGLLPMKKFLHVGGPGFYEKGHHSYAQAWALVHMLQHSTPAYAKVFKAMMKDLRTLSAYEVVERRFPDALLPELEKDLKSYVEKLEIN